MSTEIASIIPGRAIHTYDLLTEFEDKYNLGRAEAHAAIHNFLDQLIEIDGEDAVILNRKPTRPELLDSNPGDLDVYWWLEISDDAADGIRAAMAASPYRADNE